MEPTTEAGRALLDDWPFRDTREARRRIAVIEQQAAAAERARIHAEVADIPGGLIWEYRAAPRDVVERAAVLALTEPDPA